MYHHLPPPFPLSPRPFCCSFLLFFLLSFVFISAFKTKSPKPKTPELPWEKIHKSQRMRRAPAVQFPTTVPLSSSILSIPIPVPNPKPILFEIPPPSPSPFPSASPSASPSPSPGPGPGPRTGPIPGADTTPASKSHAPGPMQTSRSQHVPVAQTVPSAQSLLLTQPGKGEQSVCGPQKPAPLLVRKQKQLMPHWLRSLQREPSQPGLEQRPFWQMRDRHCFLVV